MSQKETGIVTKPTGWGEFLFVSTLQVQAISSLFIKKSNVHYLLSKISICDQFSAQRRAIPTVLLHPHGTSVEG